MQASSQLLTSTTSAAAFSINANTRWQNAQQFLPDGLPRAALHEFFLADVEGVPYLPSAFIIAGISQALASVTPQAATRKITVWIGQDRWPTPYAIPEELRAHAYFLRPRSERELLWALDAALKCPAVGAVVAHHERLPFSLSQRFALAARQSGVIGIFTRPYKMLSTPSAASFRWTVKPAPKPTLTLQSATNNQRWTVTLLKAKQSLPEQNIWVVDYEDETFSLRISPALVSGSNEELTSTLRKAYG